MIINANRISEKGVSFHDTIDADSNLLLEKESYFQEGLDYQVVLKRDGNRIRAQGKIKTAISLTCARCLETFELKINSSFDIILFPCELLQPKNSSLAPDEMEYIFYEDDQIDLDKILLEQINLFVPAIPVCTPHCKGICPNCGTNLNSASCQCEGAKNDITFMIEKDKR